MGLRPVFRPNLIKIVNDVRVQILFTPATSIAKKTLGQVLANRVPTKLTAPLCVTVIGRHHRKHGPAAVQLLYIMATF
jgi:hypothetical protein